MRIKKSAAATALAVLIASTGAYAHSFDGNGYTNNMYGRGYNMGETMMMNGGMMGYNNQENATNSEFCDHDSYMGHGGYGVPMMSYGYMRGFMHNGGTLFSLERLKRLNLSADQKNSIGPILAKMQKSRILFRGKMAELRSKMMAAKLSYPIDFNKLSSYISERAALVKDFQKEQLNSLSKIYNSLTPGQKKILTYY